MAHPSGDANEDDDDDGVPRAFLCPITQDVLVQGVVAPDGHTYEQAAIQKWLSCAYASPMVGGPMPAGRLVPNHALMSLIEAHPVAGPRRAAGLRVLKERSAAHAARAHRRKHRMPARTSTSASISASVSASTLADPARSSDTRSIVGTLGTVAVGAVMGAAGFQLGSWWQGSMESLFRGSLGMSLVPYVLGPWVGGGAALCIAAAGTQAGSVGHNLAMSGLSLPTSSLGGALLLGAAWLTGEFARCAGRPGSCHFADPCSTGVQVGAVAGAFCGAVYMFYAAVRALEGAEAWCAERGVTQHMHDVAERVMQDEGYSPLSGAPIADPLELYAS